MARRILWSMGTKSRESIYGSSVRAAAERAKEARKQADRLAVDAWNKRMLGFKGPAQPSPTLGDALNAGYGYLEVRCLGCNTHQTVALDIVRWRTQGQLSTLGALWSLQGAHAKNYRLGGLNSPATQPFADFKGSASRFTMAWSHAGHSNDLTSKPGVPRVMRAEVIFT